MIVKGDVECSELYSKEEKTGDIVVKLGNTVIMVDFLPIKSENRKGERKNAAPDLVILPR